MKRPTTLSPVESTSQPVKNAGVGVADEQDAKRSDSAENPWIALAGIFADDPTLMPMLDAIYAARDAERDVLDATQ
jgi:hypothetical protein